jgi:hypothetical protein
VRFFTLRKIGDVAVQINIIMKEINKVKPYTYLVKHKRTGKVYYGSRCKNFTTLNRTPEEDFWKHYTTSSVNINNIIKAEGKEAFEYEIRRTFDTVEEMADWETRVLTRSRVLERQDKWLNGNISGKKILTEAGAKKISETHKDKPKTEEHKNNLSKSQKGKPKKSTVYQSNEYRELMSKLKSGSNNPMFGKGCTKERAENISKAKKGKTAKNKNIPMDEKQKQKISETKEKNKVLKTCEVCGKTMRESHYKMYGHGPDCQQHIEYVYPK